MPKHIPTYWHYLAGSLFGSIIGSAALVLIGFLLALDKLINIKKYLSFVVFIAYFMFIPFIIGSPLFFMLLETRWLRFPLAACFGALVGIGATALFGAPEVFNPVSLLFAGAGVLATAGCWRIMSIRLKLKL